jgi:hypothetical protein
MRAPTLTSSAEQGCVPALDVAPRLGQKPPSLTEETLMASPTQKTDKVRKHKMRTCGASRKVAIRRAHRIQSEKVLEIALGEHFALDTVRK